jgi:hypothetical protein
MITNATSLTSVKSIPFDRNEDEYCEWTSKALAFGREKGFDKALTESRMVKETPGTEEAKKIKKENNTAYNFLIQSVMGTAFLYVKNANGHALNAF